jgi:hypothetical protein
MFAGETPVSSLYGFKARELSVINQLLRALSGKAPGTPKIEAKRRVLTREHNSRALVEMARLSLARIERGLKGG